MQVPTEATVIIGQGAFALPLDDVLVIFIEGGMR
jgi:hypothetical protein